MMKRAIKILSFQLIFWGLSYFILLQVFTYKPPATSVDYIYTALFHLFLISGVMINTLHLLPKHLQKGKILSYCILIIMNIGLMLFIFQFTFDDLARWFFPDYYFISYWENWEILLFAFAYIVLSTLLVSFIDWIKNLNLKNQLIELENKTHQQQLQTLKSQINPHFLFNSLNNLFALTKSDPQKSSRYVLKLSELLRYTLYETNPEFSTIAEEIQFLENYLSLEKIRHNQVHILFEKSIQKPDFKVPALIFLPLVENAFKHGQPDQSGVLQVKIDAVTNSKSLFFCVENSCNASSIKNNHQGIGIENTQKRLALAFGSKQSLDISRQSDTFKVEIKIYR